MHNNDIMQPTRRDLALLIPALAAAQTKSDVTIPSTAWPYDRLESHKSGPGTGRNVFNGTTHTGYHVDMHITELPQGEAPHAPHHHVHEEMVFVFEGALDVTINGKTTRIGKGGTAYVASNEEHGWRAAPDGPAKYFVTALGRDS